MLAYSPSDWSTKLQALRSLPTTTWAAHLAFFPPPPPSTFITVNNRRFLVTRSTTIDGLILAVAPHRASCLVAIQLAGQSALVVVSDTPAMLDTVVNDVLTVLGDAFTVVPP